MTARPASLRRRIGAMLYDTFLVLALLFAATLPFVAMRGGESVEPSNPGFQITLIIVVYAFFVGFWTQKGRTLGMQAWGLRCEAENGGHPDLGPASLRFFAACFSWAILGLGFLWQLLDREKLSLHDRISGTRLIHYS